MEIVMIEQNEPVESAVDPVCGMSVNPGTTEIVAAVEGQNYYFEDRGSSGGSYLNSTELQKRQPAVLHDGDLLELGKGAHGARLLIILP